MPRKGPIRLPNLTAEEENRVEIRETTIDLPPWPVIDAGIAKFEEMAKLHWPAPEGGFKLVSFDIRNNQQLRMTLGLVYMAMRKMDKELDRGLGGN